MDNFMTGMKDFTDIASPLISSTSFGIETLSASEDFLNISNTPSLFTNLNTPSISNFSSEFNFNSDSSTGVSQGDAAFSSEMSPRLEIIEQPFQRSKLRYRSDYIREKTRLGVLTNKNKTSSCRGPIIRIPQCYLNPNDEYYICVCLVTVIHDKTNLRYIHPYELENPCDELLNDRTNNAVWFRIKPEDFNGTQSFPLLRIIKQHQSDILKLGHLRVFDFHDQNSENNVLQQFCWRVKTHIIEEYNLGRSQLAFTIGKKVLLNDQLSMIFYSRTTIFSDEIIECVGKELYVDKDIQSPPNSCVCQYCPRSGLAERNEEVIVLLKNRLEPRKYGKLQVTMECNTSDGHWLEPVLDLQAKDRMISFKTLKFPYTIKKTLSVDIKLEQDNRKLGVLKYSYLPTASAIKIKQNLEHTASNKHRISHNHTIYLETNRSAIPVRLNNHEIRQPISEPDYRNQDQFSAHQTSYSIEDRLTEHGNSSNSLNI